MPIRSLEQPVINAIIRYAYALREDEEAALLSAFLAISYHIHREAVKCMMPAEQFDELMSTPIPATGAEESFVETASGLTYREPLIIGHIHHVIATASNLPGSIRSAIIEPVHAAITKPVAGAIARLRKSIRFVSRRQRENILQEEEELALFDTIEGVAAQVQMEALEREIIHGPGGKGRFATACGQAGEGPWSTKGEQVRDAVVARKSRNDAMKRHRGTMDTYSEFMEEEIIFIGRIIDRNRALSQGYLNAHAT